jgi:hypothetical protein
MSSSVLECYSSPSAYCGRKVQTFHCQLLPKPGTPYTVSPMVVVKPTVIHNGKMRLKNGNNHASDKNSHHGGSGAGLS